MSDAPSTPAAPSASSTASAPQGPKEFMVSSPPHLASGSSTPVIMFQVVAAMIPLFIAGVIFFGTRAVILTIAVTAACLITEAIANAIRGRDQRSLFDGSAIVTGMILAFSLPPALPTYMAFIGGVVAIALAKAIFGGIGHNLFNPAMVGRAFLMICFPAAMGVWSEPMTMERIGSPDAVTAATPLGASEDPSAALPSLGELFLGEVGGCVGETSALAALIGGIFLLARGVADYRPAIGMLASAFVFATIAHWAAPDDYQGPMYHLLSGAMLFGAFFIATDYVGAPITPTGRWIFGIGTGVLVMVIRLFGAYPEGVMFAILIMNSLTPLIERWTVPTPFGGHVATA